MPAMPDCSSGRALGRRHPRSKRRRRRRRKRPVDLHKFGIKFFAAPPTEVRLAEFIPVFHRWIQNHVVEGLLIDVADYSHIVDGPGIVLVAHDGNYAMDETGGRLGLLYVRKQPLAGDLAVRLARAAEIALEACGELEGAPEFAGRLKFRT